MRVSYGVGVKVSAMSSGGRDRHGRGLRGPLALSGPMTSRRARPPSPGNKFEFFQDAVQAAVDRIGRQCPEVLVGVSVGIEDVPYLEAAWTGPRVPLAAAVDAVPDKPAQVVVFRRPLEHRAASRRGLRILVYRTIVEQLSALTGRSVSEIDPEGLSEDD
jgi:hypothetical protein